MTELIEQYNRGEMELWFFDEYGFDQQPSVLYAWQPLVRFLKFPPKTAVV